MATQKETIEFLLKKLRYPKRFATKAMFGEYALYADGNIVALVCDNLLHVKVLPASQELEPLCAKAAPYPGAKPYYLVEEVQLSTIHNLPEILLSVGKAYPKHKKKGRK